MNKKNTDKQFAVFGLGRFGSSVALTLYELGYDVLGVDKNEEVTQSIADQLTHVVTADVTDENVLRSLGIRNYDTVVIGIDSLEDNLMTTFLLKEIGIPFVVVKATSTIHGKMLQKVGADKIVYPERDTGKRVAHNLISNSILDYIEMSDDISVISIIVPQVFVGKNLVEANLRKMYNLSVVAVKRREKTIINPDPFEALQNGDELIIVGGKDNIDRLEELI